MGIFLSNLRRITNTKRLRDLAEAGTLSSTERAERRRGVRQHIEIVLSNLKRIFSLGETLATKLIRLATRIAAKIRTYTYAFMLKGY